MPEKILILCSPLWIHTNSLHTAVKYNQYRCPHCEFEKGVDHCGVEARAMAFLDCVGIGEQMSVALDVELQRQLEPFAC